MNGVLLRLAWRALIGNRNNSLLLLVIMAISTTLMSFFTFSYLVVNRQAITANELVAPQMRAKLSYQPDLAQQLPGSSSYLDRSGKNISSLNAADRAISTRFAIGQLLPEEVQAVPTLVFAAQVQSKPTANDSAGQSQDEGQQASSGIMPISLTQWELFDPQKKAIQKGRYPRGAEIALSPEQAELLGVKLGDQVKLDYGFGSRSLTLVGLIRNWHTYIRNAAVVGPGMLSALCAGETNRGAIICENSQYFISEAAGEKGYSDALWYSAGTAINVQNQEQQLLMKSVPELFGTADSFRYDPAPVGTLAAVKASAGNLDQTGKYVSDTATAPNETWLPEQVSKGQLFVASYQLFASEPLREATIKNLSLKHLRVIDVEAGSGLKTSLLRTHLSNFVAPVLYYTASLFLLTLPLLTIASRRQVKEIKTLYVLGVGPKQLRRMLILQTSIIALIAALLGLFLGFILVQTFISTYIAARSMLWLVSFLIFLLGFSCGQAASLYSLRNLLKAKEDADPRYRLNSAWVISVVMLLVVLTTMPLANLLAGGKPGAIFAQKVGAIILLCLMAPIFLRLASYLKVFVPNWVLGRIVLSNLGSKLYRLAPGVSLLILVSVILGTQVLNITRVEILEGFNKQTIHYEYVDRAGEEGKQNLDWLSTELSRQVGELNSYDYQGITTQVYAQASSPAGTEPAAASDNSIAKFLLPYRSENSSASTKQKNSGNAGTNYYLPQRYQLGLSDVAKISSLDAQLEDSGAETTPAQIYRSEEDDSAGGSAFTAEKMKYLAEKSSEDIQLLDSGDVVVDDGQFLSYLGFSSAQVQAAKKVLERQGLITVGEDNILNHGNLLLLDLPAAQITQNQWRSLSERGGRSQIVEPQLKAAADLDILSLKSPKSQRSWVLISPQLAENMHLDTQLRGRIITPQDYVFPYQIWDYIEEVLPKSGEMGIYANFYFFSKSQVSWLIFSAILAMLMAVAIMGVVVNMGISETLEDLRVLYTLGVRGDFYKQSSLLAGVIMGICGFVPGFLYAVTLQFIPLGLSQVNNQWGLSTWVIMGLLSLAAVGVCGGAGYLFAPRINGGFSQKVLAAPKEII